MTNLSRLRAATALLALFAPVLLAPSATAQTSGVEKAPATPIATGYPAAGSGDGVNATGYSLSRWAEDWRSKGAPEKRDDPLDRLKFLPLAANGEVYVTLSGEFRLRMNHTTNPNARDSAAQRQDIVRIVGGADLHVGPHLRGYLEMAHGSISGVELGAPAATLRNALTVQQAFVEGDVDVGTVSLGARYGRQEFTDGPNLLVSQRDNNTIRYTLNGIRLWAKGKTVRADLFDLKPTAYGDLGTDDDVSDPARRFSGVSLGFAVPKTAFGGSSLFVDPFFWRRKNSVGAWGGRIGPAERFYAGVHAYGDAGPMTIDWTLNHQFGTYIDQRIDAWQLFLAQTYRIGKAKTAPRLGVHFDYASGGGGYGGRTLRNAYAPFGNNIYYSYQLFLTPSNLVTLAPNITVSPAKALRLTAEYALNWRADANDAVYRANGAPFAGTQKFHAARIANVSRLQAVWAVTPRVSLTGRYEHLAAGPALRDAGYASSDFLAGWISLRF